MNQDSVNSVSIQHNVRWCTLNKAASCWVMLGSSDVRSVLSSISVVTYTPIVEICVHANLQGRTELYGQFY